MFSYFAINWRRSGRQITTIDRIAIEENKNSSYKTIHCHLLNIFGTETQTIEGPTLSNCTDITRQDIWGYSQPKCTNLHIWPHWHSMAQDCNGCAEYLLTTLSHETNIDDKTCERMNDQMIMSVARLWWGAALYEQSPFPSPFYFQPSLSFWH